MFDRFALLNGNNLFAVVHRNRQLKLITRTYRGKNALPKKANKYNDWLP